MRELVDNPDATPSARVIEELTTANCSFFEFAMDMAEGHRRYFNSIEPLADKRRQALREEAASSIERQRDIENSDEISFDDYLDRYFNAD